MEAAQQVPSLTVIKWCIDKRMMIAVVISKSVFVVAKFVVVQILSALPALEDAGVEDFVSKIETFVEINTSPQTRKRFAKLLTSTLVTTCAEKANNILGTVLLKVEPKEGQVCK